VQQYREARGSFDKRADGGAIETEDEITLPVTGDGAVASFGRSLADEDVIGDKALATQAGARLWDAECTTGAEARREFASQGASALNEQGLVDGLMRDSHGRIIGEIDW
jgi:hypothetical protein